MPVQRDPRVNCNKPNVLICLFIIQIDGTQEATCDSHKQRVPPIPIDSTLKSVDFGRTACDCALFESGLICIINTYANVIFLLTNYCLRRKRNRCIVSVCVCVCVCVGVGVCVCVFYV